MDDIILSGTNLTHKFENILFENLNINIQKKQIIAIVGVSGCGKSTLLHILSSLLKPLKGDVVYKNKLIYQLKYDDLLKIRREEFGIIFQNHYLFRGFSGFENLLVSSILSKKNINFNILQKLKIDDVIKQNTGSLSGGQQQRLSIARVLVKKPKIIFADEPTGNLDEQTSFEVVEMLSEYVKQNNSAMVMVTHNMELANMCDKTFKIEHKNLKELK